jgi:hypothetical protein
MSQSEWCALGERLRLSDRETFDDLVVGLRALVESTERAAVVAATGSPLARAVLSAPRTRESR